MRSTVRNQELAQLLGSTASAQRFYIGDDDAGKEQQDAPFTLAAVGAHNEAHPGLGHSGGFLLPPCGTLIRTECLHEGGDQEPLSADPFLTSWRETNTYAKLRQWVRQDTLDRESLVAILDDCISTGRDSGIASAPADISLGTNRPFTDDASFDTDLLLPPCFEELSRIRQDLGGNA